MSARQYFEKKFRILLVDDSSDDRMLYKLALRKLDFLHLVAEAEDGVEAVHYLKGEGAFADRERFPLPDLILLDLKMPRMSGFDFLEWFRSSGPWNVKVVVLCGSREREDARRAMALGADFYQIKPVDPDDRVHLLRQLEAYMVRQHREPDELT